MKNYFLLPPVWENIVSFTQILIPAFYIAVAMCYASVTAGAFYQLNLLLLYAVEIIFPEVVLPMIFCFVFVSVIFIAYSCFVLLFLRSILYAAHRAKGTPLLSCVLLPFFRHLRS